MNPIIAIASAVTERAARSVAENLRAMPPDKQTWRPLDAGRSALSIVQECAVLNRFFARTIRELKAPEWTWEQYNAECATLDTAEKALQALDDATQDLVAAIRSVSETDLTVEVALPFGEGFKTSLQDLLFFAHWNMTYHQGQLAYIQTLYGDMQMHGMS